MPPKGEGKGNSGARLRHMKTKEKTRHAGDGKPFRLRNGQHVTRKRHRRQESESCSLDRGKGKTDRLTSDRALP